MKKVTPQDGQSANIVGENIEKLKALFPDAFSEGGINFDVLRQFLGDASVLDEGEEKYGINWHGKKHARQIASTPSIGTLLACPKESLDWEKTKNVFVEGDNLEAMKLLSKSYASKVKLIYIDPPYNTDTDFIYPDRFSEGLDTYLKYTGQKDSDGEWQVSKSAHEKTGRKHTNWLSMMLARLKVAHSLLKRDGVIFVSIDDNEQANLKRLCDEVFGEENFINMITVKAKPSAGASGGGEDVRLKKNVEYLLCYCKDRYEFGRFNDVYEERNLFSFIKDYKDEGKSWKYTRAFKTLGTKSFFKDVKDGSGENIKIFKHENIEIATISEIASAEGCTEEAVYIKYFDRIFRDTNAQSSIRQRVLEATDSDDTFYSIEYIPTSGRNKGKLTTLYYKGRNKDIIAWLKDVAVKDGKQLLKREKVGTFWGDFNWNNVSKEGQIQFPNGKKPIAFIQRMIQLTSSSEKDDLILDFFAGSGSVAHAVLQQNLEDGGHRRWISIQLPEEISAQDRKKFYSSDGLDHIQSVSDVATTRLKRVRASLDEHELETTDTGFRFFRLSHSSVKAWVPDRSDLENTLLSHSDHLIGDRSEQEILFELLLKRGVELTESIDVRNVSAKTIYSVGSGVLFACLDKSIKSNEVDALAQGIIDWHKELEPETDTHVFFRDSAFADDITKTNMAAILEQNGITHVRSL